MSGSGRGMDQRGSLLERKEDQQVEAFTAGHTSFAWAVGRISWSAGGISLVRRPHTEHGTPRVLPDAYTPLTPRVTSRNTTALRPPHFDKQGPPN